MQNRQRRWQALRIQDTDFLVAEIEYRTLFFPHHDLDGNSAGRGTQQPPIRQRGDIARFHSEMLQVLGRVAEPRNGDSRAGEKRYSTIGHRRRAAAVIRSQPAAVFRSVVQAKFRVAFRTVQVNCVQQRFHLAAVEEVVGADEEDSPVGQHLRLVVEDDGVRQWTDITAVGVHHEQRPRRRIVVFLERPDPRRREHDAPVRQFCRVDVVKRAVCQSLGRAAIGRNPIDVEERLTVVGHRDENRLAVESRAWRANRASAGVEQQSRFDAWSRRAQHVQRASDLHRRR